VVWADGLSQYPNAPGSGGYPARLPERARWLSRRGPPGRNRCLPRPCFSVISPIEDPLAPAATASQFHRRISRARMWGDSYIPLLPVATLKFRHPERLARRLRTRHFKFGGPMIDARPVSGKIGKPPGFHFLRHRHPFMPSRAKGSMGGCNPQ